MLTLYNALLRPGLLYDARMRQHRNESNLGHPECPDRITRIWDMLSDKGLVLRCTKIEV